jgi:DNA-binding GntR family transcriptional regulator
MAMSELSSLPELRTRAQAVAAGLRRDILEGRILGGSRLRQTQIAERFGVSTTPVREAFGLLSREGLVETDPHRGAVVVMPTQGNLRENFEIRIALQGLAAELASTSITPAELADLRRLLDEMRETEDRTRYGELSREFHEVVCRAARRPQLLSLTLQLYDSAAVFHTLQAEHGRDTRHTTDEHQRIFDALEAHEPRLAAEAVAVHLRRRAEFLTRLLPDEDGSD